MRRSRLSLTGLVAGLLMLSGCGNGTESGDRWVEALERSSDHRSAVQWEVCRLEDPPDLSGQSTLVHTAWGFGGPDSEWSGVDHTWTTAGGWQDRRQTVRNGDSGWARWWYDGTPKDFVAHNGLQVEEADGIAELAVVDVVLAALEVHDARPVDMIDDEGRPFQRYELLPRPAWDPDRDPRLDSIAKTLGPRISRTVWVLDLWSTGGTVDRVRVMTQDLRRGYAELRFLPRSEQWEPTRAVGSVGCPRDFGAASGPWLGWTTWDQELTVPVAVTLDGEGRPYDVVVRNATEVRRTRLESMSTGGGGVRVMDGNAVEVDLAERYDAHVPLSEGVDVMFAPGTTRLEVDLIEGVTDRGTSIIGVRLQVPATEVDAWDPLEHAYGTDGGVGGVVTDSLVAHAQSVPSDVALAPDIFDWPDEGGAHHLLSDLDGREGADTLIFFNGVGDGGFPMSRGRDEQGRVVALVVYNLTHPWRLITPDGIPPLDVRQREEELTECMEGSRPIAADGECPSDAP